MPEIGDQSSMNKHALTVSVLLGVSTSVSLVWAQSSPSILEQAEQCRNITTRLERLACFDRAFSISPEKMIILPTNSYPREWKRAMDAIELTSYQRGWILENTGDGRGSSAWIALPAQNVPTDDQGPPVLLLSCINNLSRIELALPQAVVDARIQISVHQKTQFWRSDDTGVLFSSARGMPAIEMMKLVASEPRLLLRSNASFADGLQFDTQGLNEALNALRERCGW
ncbi:type VI secretion system-associated protein TagO [Vibrio vulnificus]|nr:type VI secretion system-associated protein VasI [Vibrio vulnificus]EHT4939586.1 type VI secretion system-associated protein TagO [Vibrio vulnificus]MCA3959750.1 type VI secretion system-associated protein TagO [Vibrio vulnificus]MDS1861391.1 type VI secretion system-associated protein VasI [Vibrio vulnificus]POB08478.1 type VI secretion system-associated protein TagO [Vibrio vulnificus]HDY7701186.1 type VI secretion system-associated protein TagO [Vibrio vulnificus]